jgi:hypothetical protein
MSWFLEAGLRGLHMRLTLSSAPRDTVSTTAMLSRKMLTAKAPTIGRLPTGTSHWSSCPFRETLSTVPGPHRPIQARWNGARREWHLDFRALPLDQQRISKLMGAIASLVGGSTHAVKDRVVGECSE